MRPSPLIAASAVDGRHFFMREELAGNVASAQKDKLALKSAVLVNLLTPETRAKS
jgi:hypothetical protein